MAGARIVPAICVFDMQHCDRGHTNLSQSALLARASKAELIWGNALSAGADTQARMAAAPSRRRENIPLAILCIVASGAVFNCANAASKWLVGTYPVGEVL